MFHRSLLLAAPMALLLSGTSAFALTADQVWADLQALAAGGGGEIKAATEVKEDGAITLNGVSVGPAGGPAVITIAEMSIEDQDDGSVAFFPVDIKMTPPDGTVVAIEDKELSVSVFEDEGGLGYAVFADLLKLSFDDAPGADPAVNNAGNVTFEGLEATYGRAADGMSLDLTAGRLAYDITTVDPAAAMDTAVTSDSSNLVLGGVLSIPEGVNLMALEAPGAFEDAVEKGLAMTMSMTGGVSKGTIQDRNPAFPYAATYEGGSSSFELSMDSEAVRMNTAAPGFKMEITPAAMPMVMPISMDNMAMTFVMPVAAPEGGEYQLKLNLANLVLGEGIWAMFDPGAALPRDPATLALDLSGQAKMDLLALSRAQNGGMAEVAQPEPISLDIKDLGLKLAGAALTGTGAFTFDNSMLAAGGPPMPLGTANLRLEGGNKLIDGLIATGLLKEEDAMGARMMMAMFGKPEGDDVLTSQIEAKEGGSIFVNGQQIQ